MCANKKKTQIIMFFIKYFSEKISLKYNSSNKLDAIKMGCLSKPWRTTVWIGSIICWLNAPNMIGFSSNAHSTSNVFPILYRSEWQ